MINWFSPSEDNRERLRRRIKPFMQSFTFLMNQGMRCCKPMSVLVYSQNGEKYVPGVLRNFFRFEFWQASLLFHTKFMVVRGEPLCYRRWNGRYIITKKNVDCLVPFLKEKRVLLVKIWTKVIISAIIGIILAISCTVIVVRTLLISNLINEEKI